MPILPTQHPHCNLAIVDRVHIAHKSEKKPDSQFQGHHNTFLPLDRRDDLDAMGRLSRKRGGVLLV